MQRRHRNDRVGVLWCVGAAIANLATGAAPLGCGGDAVGRAEDDDGSSSTETGTSTDGGSTDPSLSVGSDTANDDSSSVGETTSTETGGSFHCEDDAVTVAIGPEGGSVELCGARLDVLAGTLASATEFTIEHLDPPPAFVVPLEHEIAGPTFRFEPSGMPLGDYVRVTLPHQQPGRVVLPWAVADGELLPMEPCFVDDDVSVVDVAMLGTFVSTYEIIDYPDSVNGLGGGEMTADFAGDSYVFGLDDSPNHAVHFGADDQPQVLELDASLAVEPYHHLLVQLTWDPATGDAEVAQASLALFDGGNVALWATELEPDAVVELTELGDHMFEGTASIPVVDIDGATEILEVALSFHTERWRYPIEMVCAPGFQ